MLRQTWAELKKKKKGDGSGTSVHTPPHHHFLVSQTQCHIHPLGWLRHIPHPNPISPRPPGVGCRWQGHVTNEFSLLNCLLPARQQTQRAANWNLEQMLREIAQLSNLKVSCTYNITLSLSLVMYSYYHETILIIEYGLFSAGQLLKNISKWQNNYHEYGIGMEDVTSAKHWLWLV